MSSKSRHVGLQVVKLSQTRGKRYEVDEEALASVLLREDVRNLPVVVVSVAGAYRGGKSFLLNFFLRYLKASRSSQLNYDWMGNEDEILQGFEWRGGADTNTKGIHLWPEPIFVTIEKTGEKVAVLLMDTQGTFDTESDMHYNSTIFALSTLLSSVQIYNLRSNIGGDDLQHLQLFTKYGRLVSGAERKAFQTLIFLIRDWMSPYQHPYGYNGGEALLNKKLQMTQNQTKELREVCQQIYSCFDKLQCFLMPHPGLAVADQNFKGRLCDIAAHFKTSLLELVPSLFDCNNLTPKIINGEKVQAQDLLEYFKQYVNIFNSSDMPEVTTMYQATATASLMAILREARQLYESKMGSNVIESDSVTTSMVQHWHDEAVSAAVELYKHKKKLGSEEDIEKYLDNLKKELKARLPLFQWQNDAKVRQRLLLAKKNYEDAINSVCKVQARLNLHPDDLQTLHQQALQGALLLFKQGRPRVPQEQDEQIPELTQYLQQRYQALRALNEQNNKSVTLEAREQYITSIKSYMEQFTVSSTMLKIQHEKVLQEAVNLFNSHRNRPTEESEDSFLGQLKQDIMKYYEECQKLNFDKNTRAMQSAEYIYNNYVLSAWGPQASCFHPKGLEKVHEEGKEQALTKFLSHRIKDEQNSFKQQLFEKVNVRYQELQTLNFSNNRQTVERAFGEYRELMDRDCAPSVLSLLIVPFIIKLLKAIPEYHEVAKAKALSIFHERRRGDYYSPDTYLDDLNQQIDKAYGSYVDFFTAVLRELGIVS